MNQTPFGDLDDYFALQRVSGLAMSPDGSRLVTTISELNEKRTEYITAVWELDPRGLAPARRLTRGAKGESAPVFASDGDLLFLSARPADDDDKPPASLWQLPAAGGEAVEIFAPPGGVELVKTARAGATAVVRTPLLPSARGIDDDRRLRQLRKDNKVTAIVHSGYPIRHWDKDLGPAAPHLFTVNLAADHPPSDLTPQPGGSVRDADFDVSSDGSFVVTSWKRPARDASEHSVLVRIDLASGERTVIADDPEADLWSPVISPDGSAVAFVRESYSTPDVAPRISLGHFRFGENSSEVSADWDRWPASVTWSHDGDALLVTADEGGRCPVFRVPIGGAVEPLTGDDYAYTDVVAAPGDVVYALRSSYAAPPHPVRIDKNGTVGRLRCIEQPKLPGTLTELTADTPDGGSVRSWLVLPESEAPAPLLLWIHGGPLASWNSWHWRWNPWVLAARGYAVLLPDPALSTGYGQDFIQRGWGSWGRAPFDDLMAATDAACSHPRIDATRTAVMGGSFGGYMANWIAGHTDRFDAIVTHAGLWALDQFNATTDAAYYWRREMTQEMAEANSPHRAVSAIRTPMLVIHGDKDYRVPIGEALRLWYELLSESGLPAADDGTSPHRFLYYPSENHWVLAPQNAKVWYQVVIAFLAEHVLGEACELPETLG
ncbi:peptidase S9 [Mycobacteriaceae bacterium 1482268.1]|nr:peptidase S9 [Mycobacteriaceae bacterium 1482268.1]